MIREDAHTVTHMQTRCCTGLYFVLWIVSH